MDFWRSLSGTVEVELISADPAGALRPLTTLGSQCIMHGRTEI